MIGTILVLLLGQVTAVVPRHGPLERLQAKVHISAVTNLTIQRLAGEYSYPAKELGSGLSGNDLYLFPGGMYIYDEWADIQTLTIRDKGTWKIADGVGCAHVGSRHSLGSGC
jgi:hypothetical protein